MFPESSATGSRKTDLLLFALMMTLLAINILGLLGLALSATFIADAPLLALWYVPALYLGGKNFLLLWAWFSDRDPSRVLVRYAANSLIILATGFLVVELF